MTGRLHLGTSGFAYAEWKGDFYPADIKPSAMLAYYAQRFPSVEINYTFQTTPEEKTLLRWIADTPDDFVFSLKAHRSITHMRRLSAEAAEPLAEFLTSCKPLEGRLGAVLFQCPPNMKADLPRLEAFLASLPKGRRYAFEFRHGTWNDDAVYEVLRAHDIAWCVADTDEITCSFVRTARDFAYLRLRKTMYEDEELAGWAKQIGEALADGVDVYCYFKHEGEARGVRFARALGALLGVEPPEESSSQQSLPGF
jgi:uncharacterized protein YecE (DUF72 family)